MDRIFDFLRNNISGWTYVIVVILSLFFIFVIIGYLVDRQNNKLEAEIKKAKKNTNMVKNR